jgi:ERCC4-type nuclease
MSNETKSVQRGPMKSLTVLIDSREKTPLLFPNMLEFWPDKGTRPKTLRVKSKVLKLDAGDYQLEGYEDCSIFERKGSLRELHNNFLTSDFPRFKEAIERLSSACLYPYLLLDIRPADMVRPTTDVPNPARVFDELCRCIHHYGLRLFYAGKPTSPTARRCIGSQVLRLMLGHALQDEYGDPNIPISAVIKEVLLQKG